MLPVLHSRQLGSVRREHQVVHCALGVLNIAFEKPGDGFGLHAGLNPALEVPKTVKELNWLCHVLRVGSQRCVDVLNKILRNDHLLPT